MAAGLERGAGQVGGGVPVGAAGPEVKPGRRGLVQFLDQPESLCVVQLMNGYEQEARSLQLSDPQQGWPYESIASSFLVRHVMTRRDEFHCAGYDDDYARAAHSLSEKGFSFAPVEDDDGRIIGIVNAADLRQAAGDDDAEYVVDIMDSLSLSNTVQANAPLIQLFEWMVETPFNIALSGRRVVGLVHLSDLNKEPVRGLLHLLSACMERRLAALIRAEFDGDDWVKLLPGTRQEEIQRRCSRADEKVDIDPLETAYLWDLTTAVIKSESGDRLQELLSWSLNDHLGGLCELRNIACHPVRPVLERPDELPHLLARIDRARELVQAAVTLLGKESRLP